jgi:hypothetical protein
LANVNETLLQHAPTNIVRGLSGLEATTLSPNGTFSVPESPSDDPQLEEYVRPAFLGWLPLVAVIFYL